MSQAMPLQIDYGERLRIGMIVPSGNVIAEAQVRAMLPPGVAVNVTRLPLTGTAPQVLHGMLDGLEHAASLLAHARVKLIAFNCTAVSTYSLALESRIQTRIEDATGIPAVLTSGALIRAMNVLSARRVALLTPYRRDVNEREAAFLQHNGIEVVCQAGLGLDHPGDMAALPAQDWFDFSVKHRNAAADAYFISCTAIRSAEVIARLEAALDRPVITSNQAIAWHCLRAGGIADGAPGYGALFEH